MNNKEMIIEILKITGCLSAKEISNFINRKFNISLSASAVSGNIRPLVQRGIVGNSNATGKTVYWLNKDFYREDMKIY